MTTKAKEILNLTGARIQFEDQVLEPQGVTEYATGGESFIRLFDGGRLDVDGKRMILRKGDPTPAMPDVSVTISRVVFVGTERIDGKYVVLLDEEATEVSVKSPVVAEVARGMETYRETISATRGLSQAQLDSLERFSFAPMSNFFKQEPESEEESSVDYMKLLGLESKSKLVQMVRDHESMVDAIYDLPIDVLSSARRNMMIHMANNEVALDYIANPQKLINRYNKLLGVKE